MLFGGMCGTVGRKKKGRKVMVDYIGDWIAAQE
jgi:hypothetical protein